MAASPPEPRQPALKSPERMAQCASGTGGGGGGASTAGSGPPVCSPGSAGTPSSSKRVSFQLPAPATTGAIAEAARHLQAGVGGGGGGGWGEQQAPAAASPLGHMLSHTPPQPVDSPRLRLAPLRLAPLAGQPLGRHWPSNEALSASDAEIESAVLMSDLPPLPPATPQHHGAPGLPAGPELAQAIMDLLPTQRRTAAVAAAASGGEVELRQATPEPSARAPAPPPRSMAERLYQLLRRLLLVAPAAAGASSASAADLAAAGSGALAASGRPGRLQAFSSAESLEQFGSARSSASDLLECGGSSHGARLFVDALSAAAADEEEEGAPQLAASPRAKRPTHAAQSQAVAEAMGAAQDMSWEPAAMQQPASAMPSSLQRWDSWGSDGGNRPATPDAAAAPQHEPCAFSTPVASAVAADTAAAAAAAVQQLASSTQPAPLQQAAPSPSSARDAWQHPPGQQQLLPRVLSFAACVSSSPLLQSALLSLEARGTHPPVAAGSAAPAGLEWTLAQLLALYLRTGEEQAHEDLLLAALWVLESAFDAARSPATKALNTYIQPLCLVSRAAAERLVHCGNWPAAFASLRAWLVAAQSALLESLSWRVTLGFERDVRPCHALLFSSWPPAFWAAPPCASDAAALELVACGMSSLCAGIMQQRQSARLLLPDAPAAAAARRPPNRRRRQLASA